ncbi:hypothetical protein C8R43DRAFT_960628 [Mycena crocata]|nr:hypothetical protein C8R43DRAFT_960628 [Mycena crocata]
MTTFPPAASGTESVPVAASSGDASTVAALNILNAAVASLTQAQASQAADAAAAAAQGSSPAVAVVQAVPLPSLVPVPTPPVHTPNAGFLTHGPWVVKSLYLVVPTAPLMAVVEADEEDKYWYAITSGRWVGITLNNTLAVRAVTGARGSHMKGYKTQAEALAAFNELLGYSMVNIVA